MNHRINFNKKLDLLWMSIEALNLYSLDKVYIKNANKIFNIRSHNYLRYPYKIHLLEFYQIIHLLYVIYSLMLNSSVQEIILNILQTDNSKDKNKYIQQYIKKYIYIYRKTQSYYNTCSYYLNYRQITDIAITNIYVINQIINIYGPYGLIKYLYSKSI